MSWFWSSPNKATDDSASPVSDVYADLDPQLRAFARGDHDTNSGQTSRTGAVQGSMSTPNPAPASDDSLQPSVLEDELGRIRSQFKSRKAQVNAGAMRNCALAEYDLNNCFVNGSWWDKQKLCEEQKVAFWACLEGNKKALGILGYGEAGNSAAQNQRLLEEADDLYMKQLAANKAEKGATDDKTT